MGTLGHRRVCRPFHGHPQKLLMLCGVEVFLGQKSEVVSKSSFSLLSKGLALSSPLSHCPQHGPTVPALPSQRYLLIASWAWRLLHTLPGALTTVQTPSLLSHRVVTVSSLHLFPNLTHQNSSLATRFDQRPDTKRLSGAALLNTLILGSAKGGQQCLAQPCGPASKVWKSLALHLIE